MLEMPPETLNHVINHCPITWISSISAMATFWFDSQRLSLTSWETNLLNRKSQEILCNKPDNVITSLVNPLCALGCGFPRSCLVFVNEICVHILFLPYGQIACTHTHTNDIELPSHAVQLASCLATLPVPRINHGMYYFKALKVMHKTDHKNSLHCIIVTWLFQPFIRNGHF